jgi:Tol biopolymer transport system component/DNA-binding winged helix-turn-helix (wHTH) protein
MKGVELQQFGEITVDVGRLEVKRGGQVVELEPKAVRVLLYLMANRERVVPKEELFEKVWAGVEVTDNALTRVVGQLRKGLGDDARQARYIETVPTVGYRFVGKPSEEKEKTGWGKGWWAAGVMVGVGLGMWWNWGLPGGKKAGGHMQAELRQLTNSRTLDAGPTLSPDGKWLAYSSDRSGQFEIYIRPRDGEGNEVQVTRDGGPNVQAAWSPDGKWIAYHCAAEAGICAVPATGGAVRVLTAPGSAPAWSPDGKKIVYREAPLLSMTPHDLLGNFPRGLVVMDFATGERRRHPDGEANQHAPHWSGDGRWVVYAVGPDAQADRVEAWNQETGERHTVVETNGVANSLVLSAGQERLYYTQYRRSGTTGIFYVDVAPGTLRARGEAVEFVRMTLLPGAMAMGRDGKSLVVGGVEQDSNLYRLELDKEGRRRGEPQALTQNRNTRNTHPRFSPDGRKLAYVGGQLGMPGQVYVAAPDGSGAERVSELDSPGVSPVWTEDSEALIYRKAGVGLVRLDLRSRRRTPIPLEVVKMGLVAYTGKGMEGVLNYRAGTKLRIEFVDLVSKARSQFVTGEEDLAYPAISADGKWVVAEQFAGGYTHVAVAPRAGGERKVWDRGAEQAFVYEWSRDGRKVSLAGLRRGRWNLYALDWRTGEEQKLTEDESFRFFVRYPAWSAQGDYLVYERSEVTGNLFEVKLAR